jgi:hypothetical protein
LLNLIVDFSVVCVLPLQRLYLLLNLLERNEQELKKAYPSLNWQKGRLMNGATKEEIKQWTKK